MTFAIYELTQAKTPGQRHAGDNYRGNRAANNLSRTCPSQRHQRKRGTSMTLDHAAIRWPGLPDGKQGGITLNGLNYPRQMKVFEHQTGAADLFRTQRTPRSDARVHIGRECNGDEQFGQT